MNGKNLKKLGFKCGLEIHQQLKTDEKLFCNCPAGYRNDAPDAEIVRHMRPTLSELGEYDGTALMEFKTNKRVIYQLYRDSMCTYEMDDTPPFVINKKALDIAIRLALMLNCAIVDELHVSRKQYLDGSIPTGFQRTAVVGVGGWVPYKGREILLSHICLEEDACREVSDQGHIVTWRTDRLSMPLVEVITQPVLQSPQEAREVNELIGRMMKATGLVRRGIGSVRQDVNVSIDGGTRVEMKGVAKTKYVDKMTTIEANRQKQLLDIKVELKKRGLTKDNFKPVKSDVTELLRVWPSTIITSAIDSGLKLGAVKLPGFAGILKREIQPGRTFADEFSGRLAVIACLNELPNIAVSEIPEPDIGIAAREKLASELKIGEKDAVILTWGPAVDVVTAMKEIVIRAEEAFNGVPNETRQHLGDYTTMFERVLPGPDRMYPDTDSPPVTIPAESITEIVKTLPKLSWDYERKWEELGVPDTIAYKVVVTPMVDLFDKLVEGNTVNPSKIYACLKKAYKANKKVAKFDAGVVGEIFVLENNGQITSKELERLLTQSSPDNLKSNLDKLLADKSKISDSDIQSAITDEFGKLDNTKFKSVEAKLRYLIGRVGHCLNDAVDGGKLLELIKAKL
ncbi:MAG: Glu-tRNA(Gln) amidotransferase subunit GatE [candidate division Zixibacteria bacterium]|nr:Glu-tRNA(Gln) amidotransferase subunit GatE [candidate division Zixibacteria bacterium]